MDYAIFLFVLASIILVIVTTSLLFRYVDRKKTPWWVIGIVWIGWFLSFSIVCLTPLDISSSLHRVCHEEGGDCTEPLVEIEIGALTVIWRVLYWTTYILCWAVYPILQSCVLAAHFAIHERIAAALKENLVLYAAGAAIMILLMIYLLAKAKLGMTEIVGIGIAAANAYGLFLLICLLGYGLVEIPRKLWRHSNRALVLRYYYFNISARLQEYEEAKRELDTTMKIIRKYSESISRSDPFRPYIETILTKCPPQFKSVTVGEGRVDLTYDSLVSLHYRIMRATDNYARTKVMYESLLKKTYNLEDVLASATNPQREIKWSFDRRSKDSSWNRFKNIAEWAWKIHLEPNVRRAAAVACALLSLSVVWSETVFWLTMHYDGPKLSVFYWLVNAQLDMPTIVVWMNVFISLGYISWVAYWSLFQLRIFNYYRLIPNQQSDANSILFSAYYVSRLAGAMVYNYLLVISDTNSAFVKVMGPMNLAPFLGEEYNIYFPLMLVILCVCNMFNLYTKFLTKCCIGKRKFIFDKQFEDERIDHGRDIVAKEKEFKLNGLPLSIDQGISLLNAKFRTSEGKSTGVWSKIRRIFRKKSSEDEDKVELLEVGQKPESKNWRNRRDDDDLQY